MNTKNLTLRSINSLLSETFSVPKYQRGYRWTSKEVTDLLEDLLEFQENSENKPKELFYCLQPLVVSRDEDKLVVVDGQQRLTTIFLILTALDSVRKMLKVGKYTLTYETRSGSEQFLKNLVAEKRLENIDYFHIYQAYKTIKEWFEKKEGSVQLDIVAALTRSDKKGKNVKFIWYEIDNEKAVEIFTRINMGKIPLTNAELIKALFLRERNFDIAPNSPEKVNLQQIKIASEWDNMEKKLEQSDFWYFIHDNNTKYDTRIEFIFDLIKGKGKNADDNFTFFAFNEDFDSGKSIEVIWLEVKQYFMRLEEWYHDQTLYHLIGYLVATGQKIAELTTLAKEMSKIEFVKEVRRKIAKRFQNVDLQEIRYSNKSTKDIKDILLLFNIESILKNPKSSIRFPFDVYKEEKWDIEHISSIMSEMPERLNSRRNWLEKLDEYFNGNRVFDYYEASDEKIESIKEEVNELLENESISDESFRRVYDATLSYFKEDYSSEDNKDEFTDKLGNLTLLDATTNRSYKNAIFPVKRKRILQNDKNGLFVPICTKNVFLKYYSEKLNDVLFWQKSDADAYLNQIEVTLTDFFDPK